jgi:hypothetical protein
MGDDRLTKDFPETSAANACAVAAAFASLPRAKSFADAIKTAR